MPGQIKQGGVPDSAHGPCVCLLWYKGRQELKERSSVRGQCLVAQTRDDGDLREDIRSYSRA